MNKYKMTETEGTYKIQMTETGNGETFQDRLFHYKT